MDFQKPKNSAKKVDQNRHHPDQEPSSLAALLGGTGHPSTEAALNEGQNLLKLTQEIAQMGTWSLDIQTDTLHWTEEVYRIFGLDPQVFIPSYEAFLKTIHPDDRALVDKAYTNARKHRVPYELEHRIIRPDGEIRYVHEKSVEITDAEGMAIRSIGIVQDITERKQNEILLQRYQSQLEELVSQRTAELNRSNQLLTQEVEERKQAEQRAAMLLSQQMVINKLALSLGTFRQIDQIYQKVYEELSKILDIQAFIVASFDPQTKLIRTEFLVDRGTLKNPKLLPEVILKPEEPGPQSQVILSGEPLLIKDYSAEIHKSKTFFTIQDNSEPVQGSPENARDGEDFTKSILFAPMKIGDETIGVLQVQSNRKNCYSRDELDLLAGIANVTAVAVQNAQLIEKLQETQAELENLVQEKTWKLIKTSQVLDKTIEQQVEIDRALIESEGKFRSFVEQSQDGICLLNENGEVIEWNPAMEEITGISMAQVLDSPILHTLLSVIDLDPEQDHRKDFRAKIGETVKNGGSPFPSHLIEQKLNRPNGEERFIQEIIFPIKTNRGTMLGTIVRDVTEHVLTEKAVQESERQFRKMLGDVELVAVILDTHGKVSFCNHFLLDLTGWSAEEVLGQDWFEMFVPPGQGVIEMYERAIKTGDLTAHFENKIKTRSGEERLISWRNTILRDVDGAIIGTTSIGEDITERKQVEKALARQALLAEIELTITQPLDLQTALDKTIELTKSSISHSAGAAIVLVDPISKGLWIPSLDLDSKVRWHIHAEIAEPDGISRMILETQEIFLTQGQDQIRAWLGSQAIKGGIQSFVGIPLLIENEALGILYVFELRRNGFSLEDVDFLRSLANRIALVITRIRVYEALLQARITAEETARAKSQFLANMSHELRTPLNAVVIMTDLVRETKLNPVQANYIDSISLSADKLLAMIDNVLDFSKIEANKLTLENLPFNLSECIEEELDIVALQASEKGLDLAYSLSKDVPPVLVGDSVRLGQVLINLLSNAIKFTEKGSVFLSVKALEEVVDPSGSKAINLKFEVQDTGIGISSNQRDHLFKVFSQLDGSITRKYGGSGLGLAICRHLVSMMGGEIWIESSGIPGKGSTFHFTIQCGYEEGEREPHSAQEQPLLTGKEVLLLCAQDKTRLVLVERLSYWGMKVHAFPDLNRASEHIKPTANLEFVFFDSKNEIFEIELTLKKKIQPYIFYQLHWIKILFSGQQVILNDPKQISGFVEIPVKPRLLHKLLIGMLTQSGSEAIQGTLPTAEQKIHQLRVLLAEDDPTNREIILLMLKKMGYQAKSVGSGLEVIEIMENQDFDVIIMDLQMPDLDGLTATHYIRTSLPEWKQPKIIALTADSRKETLQASLDTGVDLFLTKPIRKNMLEAYLEQIETGEISQLPPNPSSEQLSGSKAANKGGIDESILENLVETLGPDDPSALENLIRTFLKSTPPLVADIRSASETGEWETFIRRLHALKGNCELFGASRLAELCREGENLARQGSYDNLGKITKAIGMEYELVKGILEGKRSTPDA